MITSKKKREEYYHALKERDRNYDGIFFAGIKTTGIFVIQHVALVNPNSKIVSFI